MEDTVLDQLVIKSRSKIVFLIFDGLGGLAMDGKAGTELQAARKPNLDRLAKESICGLLDPIRPGISPGSGPAHFALFGYDPIRCNIGRGVLSAAGVEFDLTDRDLAARVNFCTLDADGNVSDRRAGRIPTEVCARLCAKVRERLRVPAGYELFFLPEKEYRAVFILRGDGLSDALSDTDPQRTGKPPLDPAPTSAEAGPTARLLKDLLDQTRRILADEHPANMILLRGYAKHRRYASLLERFKLRSLAIANYPMYRGIAKLLGMDLHPVTPDVPSQIEALGRKLGDYDFFFVHVKYADSRGEDGDFDGKVKVFEEVDPLIPRIRALNPDVLVVTGDHSTPSLLKSHSWHPVPVLLNARSARVDRVEAFDEISCIAGGLGRQPSVNLMGLALAHAGRLVKFGA
ncbi:MAG: 2,3-bisphosphoglycerate-independent phosphoglycerate mutase [bacterium]